MHISREGGGGTWSQGLDGWIRIVEDDTPQRGKGRCFPCGGARQGDNRQNGVKGERRDPRLVHP